MNQKINEKEQDMNVVYRHIAHALARGCTDLYYVNLETDEYIEFHTDDAYGVLNEARRGTGFFPGISREIRNFVHPDDQQDLVRVMDRNTLLDALNGNRVFEYTYRRMINGEPLYVLMKVSRMEDDPRYLVIAVSDFDELMKKRLAARRTRAERAVYARLHALTGNYIVVYEVDPETGEYQEFTSSDDYEETLGQAKAGENFFEKVREVAKTANHPDDLPLFLSRFTRDSILSEIGKSGMFTLSYRLLMEGKPCFVQMKAAMAEEEDGLRLIVGLVDVDTQVRQEKEFGRRLAKAQDEANIDALTGVKNKHAFIEAEVRIDRLISEHREYPFAIVFFDVNGLKKVNDEIGHQAGDEFLCAACRIICDVFKHSPVYRVGGDEFAVIAAGRDYDNIEELIRNMDEHNQKAARTGGIVIACGMSKYQNDTYMAAVFDRADHNMYDNKAKLKAGLPVSYLQ